jgi:hypothetical protein
MRRLITVLWLMIAADWMAAGPFAATQPRIAPAPAADSRLDRVTAWLAAVQRHQPGADDEALAQVALWSNDDLRLLWIDLNVVVHLMRNPRATNFKAGPARATIDSTVRYTPRQVERLRQLACAAAGALQEPPCARTQQTTTLDTGLFGLAAAAVAARLGGDSNYVLRRGALLHSDAAMKPAQITTAPAVIRPADGPRVFRLQIADGQEIDAGLIGAHWEIARMLLDSIAPRGSEKPAPEHDDMVRDWYRATATWMALHEDHDSRHLDRGREIFRDDAELLFLSGCQHEVFAAPHIQIPTRSASIPSGYSIPLESERAELRHAEALFRRALEIDADHVDARLRLGHVLERLGRDADAARELRQVLATTADDLLRYYAELFLGAAEEAQAGYEAAALAYERAAALFPGAQSPRLALSKLARRRGDRAAALRAIRLLFDVAADSVEQDDPWWVYYIAHGRRAADLLDAVRKPFLAVHEP